MPPEFSSGLPLNIPPSQNKQNGYTLFYKEFVAQKRQQYTTKLQSTVKPIQDILNTILHAKTYLNTSLTSHPMLLANEKFV